MRFLKSRKIKIIFNNLILHFISWWIDTYIVFLMVINFAIDRWRYNQLVIN